MSLEHRTPTGGGAGFAEADTLGANKPTSSGDTPGDPLTPFGDDETEQRRLKEIARRGLFKRASVIKIGRFQLLERLGQGGMGVVYAAYDERLDRKIAVKLLRAQGGLDSVGQARIIQEARAMAKLTHSNVVAVHEVGEHEGQVFIAMEFVRGQSLDKWASTGPTWREVIAVYRQAGAGLHAAHRAGLVHRDFKPHNAIRGENGEVKVLDFGLAVRTDIHEVNTASPTSSSTRLTQTGALVGTPAYMSPEQYAGRPLDGLSDQFSFCASLYEGLYGQLPFPGQSVLELSRAITSGDVRSPPAGTSVPAWVERVVRRGLSTDPAARFESMKALLDALSDDPVQRRRRRLALAGLASVMVAAGFGLARTLGGDARRCDLGDQARALVWNEGRRDAIAAAFHASSGEFGERTWALTMPRIDAYRDALARGRVEACSARESGHESDELFDRRTVCLDLRRAGFDALLMSFETATNTTIERAAAAVRGLRPVQDCSDVAALTNPVEPPETPEAAEAVKAARTELARAHAHELAGRFDSALRDATSIRDAAEQLGYAPLIAEAWLRVGAAHQEQHTGEAARTAIERALYTALRSHHFEVAAEAAARRLFIEGSLLLDPERALDRAELARALVDASPDPWRRWLLANNLGVARRRLEDTDGARALFDEALAVLDHTTGREYERALTLANRGATMVGSGQAREAASDFEAAIAGLTTIVGSYHPIVAGVEFRLSQVYFDQGQLEQAEQHLLAAAHALPPGNPALADWIEWGRVQAMRLRRESATAHDRALELLTARRTRNGGSRPDDLAFLGLVAALSADLGEFDRARTNAMEAERLLPDSVDPAAYWHDIGEALARAGRLSDAEQAFSRCLERADRLGKANHQIRCRSGLVLTLLDMGESARARTLVDESNALLQKHPPLAREHVALNAAVARGDVLLQEGQAAAARRAHAQARDGFAAAASPNYPARLAAEFASLRSRVDVDEPATLRRAAEEIAARYRSMGPGFAPELQRVTSWLAGLLVAPP
ncbi:MAG: protein kinase [Myxococcales bacterium]|nr:protein kinase [Myxococcales bacterium]